MIDPQTLLHEMCHAAVWLLDCEQGAAHGPEFWSVLTGCSCCAHGTCIWVG